MYEKQIAAGVAVLTRHFCGFGWAKTINFDLFDMSSPSRCILGQLFGRFSEGSITLGIHWKEVSYGFDTWGDYDVLEKEWKETISYLRGLS